MGFRSTDILTPKSKSFYRRGRGDRGGKHVLWLTDKNYNMIVENKKRGFPLRSLRLCERHKLFSHSFVSLTQGAKLAKDYVFSLSVFSTALRETHLMSLSLG